jgi:hypothetical protein
MTSERQNAAKRQACRRNEKYQAATLLQAQEPARYARSRTSPKVLQQGNGWSGGFYVSYLSGHSYSDQLRNRRLRDRRVP